MTTRDYADQLPLVRSVLHPTDFSEASHRAFAHALAIALLRQTELTILNVGPNGSDDIDWAGFPQVRETMQRWGLLEPDSPRSAVYDEFQVRVHKFALPGKDPVAATVEFLDRRPHDLIVLATSGISRGLFGGSKAEAIAGRSRSRTLFLPAAAERGLVSLDTGDLDVRHILVPIGASPDWRAGAEFARRAADVLADDVATITLLHVGETMPAVTPPADGERWLWETALRQGDPVTEILAAADDYAADLVVMTTAGRDSIGDALRGTTTEQVLRRAPCPVLAVPADDSGLT